MKVNKSLQIFEYFNRVIFPYNTFTNLIQRVMYTLLNRHNHKIVQCFVLQPVCFIVFILTKINTSILHTYKNEKYTPKQA